MDASPRPPRWIAVRSSAMRKLLSFGFALVASVALDARGTAGAAQYCAQYNNGTQDCGIPSLRSCEQSIRGVGGICVPGGRSQQGRVGRSAFSPYSTDPGLTVPT